MIKSILFSIISLFSISTKQVINKPIQKVDITTSLSVDMYYCQSSYSSNINYVPLDTPLAYLNNDTQTYIYLHYGGVDEPTYRYVLTNGVASYTLGVYEYNNYIMTLMTTGLSDGYLNAFTCNDIQFLNVVGNNTTNINSLGVISTNFVSYGVTYGILSVGGSYYDNGYKNGYDNGVSNVLTNPGNYDLYNSTYIDSVKSEYYNIGYNEGMNETDITQNGFKNLVGVILNSPLTILGGIFNFEIFGVNLFSLISFLFTIGLFVFIIKLLIGRNKGG